MRFRPLDPTANLRAVRASGVVHALLHLLHDAVSAARSQNRPVRNVRPRPLDPTANLRAVRASGAVHALLHLLHDAVSAARL